jgi:large subunit ribosomal protein L25
MELDEMSETTVEVKAREEIGKNANRRLRAAGGIPAVVYGGGKDAIAISVEKSAVHDLLRQSGGENAVFLLKLAGTGKARHTMVREVVVDPISRQILHIDFQRVLMTEKVKVQVSIELLGVPEGVKNQGGVLDFITRDVEIECLPGDIPPLIELDVSMLEVGDHRQAKDLALPGKVELLEEPDRVIVSVAHSRVAQDVEEAEAEGEEVLLEAAPQEPELIGRGKGEEDQEETS